MNSDTAKPRVLVVEDQDAMRELLRDYLEQQDFEVDCCDSASAGLKMIGVSGQSATRPDFQFLTATENDPSPPGNVESWSDRV